MVDPDGVVNTVLDKEAKQKLKKLYHRYKIILIKHKNDILNNYGDVVSCPSHADFIQNVHTKTDYFSKHVYRFLNWKKSESRTILMTDIKQLQKELKLLDEQINSEEKDESISSQEIFNNKQINLNIQNKLIYLIRYKFNLFISILIIIILICSYLYIIPLLKKSFSN